MRRLALVVLALAACGGSDEVEAVRMGAAPEADAGADSPAEAGSGGASGAAGSGGAETGGAAAGVAGTCQPGLQIACPCLGGAQGVQACAADGMAWGACQCPVVDAGGDVLIGAVCADTCSACYEGQCNCTTFEKSPEDPPDGYQSESLVACAPTGHATPVVCATNPNPPAGCVAAPSAPASNWVFRLAWCCD